MWALIASLYIGNLMQLVLIFPLVGLWVKLLKIPKPLPYAGILIFATIDAYSMWQSAFDLFLLYAIGVLGALIRRFDFPTAPAVIVVSVLVLPRLAQYGSRLRRLPGAVS